MNRHSALIIIDDVPDHTGETSPLNAALKDSRNLVDDLFAGRTVLENPSMPDLAAVGTGETIKREFGLPHGDPEHGPAMTPLGEIHHLFKDGVWYTPNACPPAPPDDNGATPWQWLFYNVMLDIEDFAFCFIWDVYATPQAGIA